MSSGGGGWRRMDSRRSGLQLPPRFGGRLAAVCLRTSSSSAFQDPPGPSKALSLVELLRRARGPVLLEEPSGPCLTASMSQHLRFVHGPGRRMVGSLTNVTVNASAFQRQWMAERRGRYAKRPQPQLHHPEDITSMWWLLFCALVMLSPVILFVLLEVARRRYGSASRVSQPMPPMPKEIRQYTVPDLRVSTAALEAQFLLSPRAAIRKAEDQLKLTAGNGAELGETSSKHLRLTFEALMRQLERSK